MARELCPHLQVLVGRVVVQDRMNGLAWRLAERPFQHPRNRGVGQWRLARRAGLIAQEAIDALVHEVLLQAADRRLRQPRAAHYLHNPAALRSGEDHRGPSHMLLYGIPVPSDRLTAPEIVRRDVYNDPRSHKAKIHRAWQTRNLCLRQTTLMFALSRRGYENLFTCIGKRWVRMAAPGQSRRHGR